MPHGKLSYNPRRMRTSLSVLASACLLIGPDFGVLAQERPRLRIVVIAGEDAINVIQQKTATAPIVEVRDRNDLPVTGAIVTFNVSGSPASFASGAQMVTATTNAVGRATAPALTPV